MRTPMLEVATEPGVLPWRLGRLCLRLLTLFACCSTMNYDIRSPSHGGCLQEAHPAVNSPGVSVRSSFSDAPYGGVGVANLDGPVCFLLGLYPLYCSCSFRPPNVRLVSVAEEMEVGSHMEVLFLEQISNGSSDQAVPSFLSFNYGAVPCGIILGMSQSCHKWVPNYLQ